MKDEFFAKEQHAASMNVHALTAKEWEVLQWLSEGLPNREIAARMNVSVGTVKTHLHRIYGKMQVNGRWEAIERYKQAWTNRLQ